MVAVATNCVNASCSAEACMVHGQARLQRLEAGQYTGASGCRASQKTCSLMDESLEPSVCTVSAEGARLKDGTEQACRSLP